MSTTPPAAAPFPVPYVPLSLARVLPVDPDQPVTLTAVRCAACHRGTVVCRNGSECRCTGCDGDGWVSTAPAAEPIALAAD